MTMSAPFRSLRRIQTAKHPSDQQPGGHRPGGTPAVQAGQEAYFICLSAYGEAQMDKLRAAVCRGIEEHLSILTQGEQKELLFSLETVWKMICKLEKEGNPK